jgi:hypothetical protein
MVPSIGQYQTHHSALYHSKKFKNSVRSFVTIPLLPLSRFRNETLNQFLFLLENFIFWCMITFWLWMNWKKKVFQFQLKHISFVLYKTRGTYLIGKHWKKSPIFAFSPDENQYISMGESFQLPLILSVTIFVQPFCDGRVRYDRFDTALLMAPWHPTERHSTE